MQLRYMGLEVERFGNHHHPGVCVESLEGKRGTSRGSLSEHNLRRQDGSLYLVFHQPVDLKRLFDDNE